MARPGACLACPAAAVHGSFLLGVGPTLRRPSLCGQHPWGASWARASPGPAVGHGCTLRASLGGRPGQRGLVPALKGAPNCVHVLCPHPRGRLPGAGSGPSGPPLTPARSVPQGIWRIPVDEIDRPGSFAWHMNRSVVLLLKVLAQLRDHGTLLKVSSMLQRTPDQGK